MKWSNEELNILREYYPEKGSEFCAKLLPNWSCKQIISKANKIGLIRKTRLPWTKEEDELLIKIWTTEKDLNISENFPNRTWDALNNRATRLKIKAFNRKIKGDLRIIDIDSLTPNIAYWWGYIMADGHIGNELKVSCEELDKDHLLKFANLLGAKMRRFKQINYAGKEAIMYVVSAGNKNILSKWLSIFKMVNFKKTYSPPDLEVFIKKEFLVYFLIGFIDGDGCIYEKRSCIISVHQNWFDTLNLISKKFEEFYGYKLFVKKCRIGDKCVAKMSFYKKEIFKFFISHLNNCDYLDRKWNKVMINSNEY